MNKIDKKILVPIISLAALVVKGAFEIEIGTESQNIIADGLLAVITLVGIFMQPKK